MRSSHSIIISVVEICISIVIFLLCVFMFTWPVLFLWFHFFLPTSRIYLFCQSVCQSKRFHHTLHSSICFTLFWSSLSLTCIFQVFSSPINPWKVSVIQCRHSRSYLALRTLTHTQHLHTKSHVYSHTHTHTHTWVLLTLKASYTHSRHICLNCLLSMMSFSLSFWIVTLPTLYKPTWLLSKSFKLSERGDMCHRMYWPCYLFYVCLCICGFHLMLGQQS